MLRRKILSAFAEATARFALLATGEKDERKKKRWAR
jgi:hypothetical protein